MSDFRILPYSVQVTAEAVAWLPYLDTVPADLSAEERSGTLSELIDKAARRGVIQSETAELLSEIYALS